HDDAVGDAKLVEAGGGLVDEFLAVGQEEHLPPPPHRPVDHLRGDRRLTPARRQDEEHTPPPARDGSTKAIQRGALVWSECLHFTCQRRGRRQWTDRGVARAAFALAVCSWL